MRKYNGGPERTVLRFLEQALERTQRSRDLAYDVSQRGASILMVRPLRRTVR